MKLLILLSLCLHRSNIAMSKGSGVNSTRIPRVSHFLRRSHINYRPMSRLEFVCHLQQNVGNATYQSVEWYMDNILKYRSPFVNVADVDLLHLNETQFVQHGFKLGHTISCTVTTLVNGTNNTTPMSHGFFAGMKVLEPIMRIPVGETNSSKLMIRLKNTVPIGCTGTSTCTVWLTTYNPFDVGNSTCSITNMDSRDICGKALNSDHSGSFDIPVRIFSEGKFPLFDDFNIALRTESTAENEIWKNYAMPLIKVQVTAEDDAGYQDAFCSSMFRVTTFDGRVFRTVPSEYTMYYNTRYKTEVQIKTIHIYINGNQTSTTCAVAVRAGKDVYSVDCCSNNCRKNRNYSSNKVLSVTERQCLASQVCFPYGTCVEISVWKLTDRTKGLLVGLQSTPADWHGATMGLCGTFNNNCFDDFHFRPGGGSVDNPKLQNGPCDTKTYNHVTPHLFLDSWRIGHKDVNYITGPYNLTTTAAWTFRYCICPMSRGALAVPDINNYIPCTEDSVAICPVK